MRKTRLSKSYSEIKQNKINKFNVYNVYIFQRKRRLLKELTVASKHCRKIVLEIVHFVFSYKLLKRKTNSSKYSSISENLDQIQEL